MELRCLRSLPFCRADASVVSHDTCARVRACGHCAGACARACVRARVRVRVLVGMCAWVGAPFTSPCFRECVYSGGGKVREWERQFREGTHCRL